MRIVIDTNIVFSALLKKNSKELQIIKSGNYDFYLCQFTTLELFKHKEKIVKISKLEFEEILEAYQLILSSVYIINEKEIPKEIISEAKEICREIDINDTIFVASSIFLNSFLWTGDKKLEIGLLNKKFVKIIKTSELLKEDLIN